MKNYVSTLGLCPITDGDRSYIKWDVTFECLPEEEAELTKHLEELFQLGF